MYIIIQLLIWPFFGDYNSDIKNSNHDKVVQTTSIVSLKCASDEFNVCLGIISAVIPVDEFQWHNINRTKAKEEGSTSFKPFYEAADNIYNFKNIKMSEKTAATSARPNIYMMNHYN